MVRVQVKARDTAELGYARLALAAYLLYYYARLYPELGYYFGPGGMIAPGLIETTPRLSLLFLAWNPIAIQLMLWLVVSALVAFGLGVYPRIALAICLPLHLSFHHANPLIIHEPQQIANLLLLLFIVLPCDSGWRAAEWPKRRRVALDPRTLTWLVAYLGIYYLLAGAKKLADPLWRSGEALWFLMQWPPFYVDSPVSGWLVAHPGLCRWLTWGTLAFEITFLPAAFSRIRPLLVPVGAIFHAGILMTLEVGSFPFVLAPWYALLLDGRTRDALAAPFRRLR